MTTSLVRQYKWRQRGGCEVESEDVSCKSKSNDFDTNSRLHNWHFQNGAENDAENSKEMDFYISVPTRKKQDGKDTGKIHREVINDDENSDTDYQTSLEDQDDFRSTHTRHEQLPTQTATSRSDFDIMEWGQIPTSHVTIEVPQTVKQHSVNGDTEYLARQFGELQQAFSSMLHRSEKDADKGIRNLSRRVTVDTSGENPHVITSSRNERHLQNNYSRNADCNTVTTYTQVHQPSTSTSSSSSKRSRRLKSSVVVPCHSTLYNPEKRKAHISS